MDRSKLDGALTQARNDTADQAAKDGKITQDQARQSESLTGVGDFGLGGSRLGNRGDGKLFGGSGVMIAVAKALGMTTQDLRTQLQSGKTLAQLATGKEQAVKDAIVAAEKAQSDQAVQSGKMTQEQENQRLDQARNSDLIQPGHFGGRGGPGGKSPKDQAPGAAKPR